ncbi:MAG: PqqD family protein [Xanthomonadaceae bacterium]|nr:PqqD family protein [Xanthomonadaceae bacterium]
MPAFPNSVTLESRLVRSPDVLFQEVGGEAVLLDLASEQYFGLDPVGTRIWELLDGEAPLARIHHTLAAEYDAKPARIGEDLLALAQTLLDAGLVQPR